MKKALMSVLTATMFQAVSAQTVVESGNQDNWYLGVNAGVLAKTVGTPVFENLNPQAGIRVGRWFTPAVGLALDGQFSARNRPERSLGTLVRGTDVSLLGTLNLNNWLGGYPGTPRMFEVIAVAGLGWHHLYATPSNEWRVKGHNNAITSKLAVDFAFNLGEAKAWQLYLEPTIDYQLAGGGRSIRYDINRSVFGLNVGVNYKFGNSNGTHNFKIAQLYDQTEVDALNKRINELRQDVSDKDAEIQHDAQVISDLRAQLEQEKQKQPTVVRNVTTVVKNNVLQPTIIFGQGKSTVDAAQMASVAMVAKYMKNHPECHILIKGYASPEGNPELNQRLSEARANAVKSALVSRYGISASRLSVQGMGATDELFDEIDFNRVATFTDTTK